MKNQANVRVNAWSVVCFVLALMVSPLLRAEEAQKPAAPAGLGKVLKDFIAQLETDSVKAPAKYAKDEKTAKLMQEHWEAMKKAHEKHDYRKWIESAQKVEDETKFVVGGHEYSHLHVEWTKDQAGWKLSGIWFCR